jgi:regulation of enolase protein 1 (concanavalin A-like superfamily)
MDELVTVPSLPMPLSWQALPAQWSVTSPSSLTVTAGAGTDLFINPQGAPPVLNAARLFGAVAGDFQLSTHLTVDFGAAFDAGALLIWRDENHWAKLCFEYSPRQKPMIVSVVTRGTSDDANGFVVASNRVWLRVSRLGTAFAFHASTDGHAWELIRHFALDTGERTELGFQAQSPTGTSCKATFDDIRFAPERLRNLRSGE